MLDCSADINPAVNSLYVHRTVNISDVDGAVDAGNAQLHARWESQDDVLAHSGVRMVLALTPDDKAVAGVLNDYAVVGQVLFGRGRTNDVHLCRRARTDFHAAVNPGHFHSGSAGEVVALIGFILEGPFIVALVVCRRGLQSVRHNRKYEGGANKKPN